MFHIIGTILFFLAAQLNGISNEIISEKGNEIQEELCCAMLIMKEQPDSIEFYEEGKLYLKSEKIFPTRNGLFLCNKNSFISLPIVHSTERGSYITFQPKDEWRVFYKCSNPKCGNEFLGPWKMGQTSICPLCRSVAYKM